MRVLLPLKNKRDDPNSQEHGQVEGYESFDSETGEYLEEEEEEGDEPDDSESEESSYGSAADDEEEEEVSSEELVAAAASATTAAPEAPSSSASSIAPHQPQAAKSATAGTDKSPAPAVVSKPSAVARQEQQQTKSEQEFASEKQRDNHTDLKEKKAQPGHQLEARCDKKGKSQGNSSNNNNKPASFSSESSKSAHNSAFVASLADPPAPAVVAEPPASSEKKAAVVTSPPRVRKRRAPSPPAALDSKPPFKKGRDSKLPAKPSATASASLDSKRSANSNNGSKKMAGGGSRGGRKLWSGTSPSSYYVETSNNGREDVSNSEDGAEVDVRFAYNDPATTTMTRSNSSATSNTSSSSSMRSMNYNRSNSFQSECGRDDVDVRERDDVDRPEGDDDNMFALALKKNGLEIVEQEGDGNCLFRAISLQVYGDASMHGEVRHRCLDFMARDKEHFSQFITDEPFEQYIGRKRQDGVHGNNPEIQAISELFNRPIEVFVPENGAKPLNIFHAEYKTQDAPIRLSYHDGNHYNAVIDPLVPTAGLGLGLPGLQPGLADKMQMAKAVAESDRLADQTQFERALEESHNDQLQRAIKESTLTVDNMYQHKALSLSDCDATNFELEQAVLESSLESFRTFEHGRKKASSSPPTVGRRKRSSGLPQQKRASQSAAATSSVASMPNEARQDSSPIPRAASAAVASSSVASAPAVASRPSSNDNSASAAPMPAEHYPQSVQELVMNGFELRKVVHAYELVGDNFDDLLGFLMSNTA